MLSLTLQTLFALIRVAFYTLFERKLLGYIQVRKGPNKPSITGLLVPLGDALKLMTKEARSPKHRNKVLFFTTPFLALMIPLLL